MDATPLIALAADALGMDPDELAAAAEARNFIALGGDSLGALRLSARAESELLVHVPAETLLSAAPLSDVLASAVPASRSTVAVETGGSPTQTGALVTPAQRGVLLLDELIGGSAYNLVFTARIRGPLDSDVLEQALHTVVARHEMLHSIFPPDEHDEGRRREVIDGWRPVLTRMTFGGSAGQFDGAVRAVVDAEGRRPLRPGEHPPLRTLLLTGGPEVHALVVIVHHAIVDGWAVGLLLEEIVDTYATMVVGDAPQRTRDRTSRQLADRLRGVENSGEIERQIQYWQVALRDVPHVLEFPSDLTRPPVQDPRGARLPFQLPPEVGAVLSACAGRLGVTPFTIFLASYGLVLARYTGQRRLVVGVPLSGRDDPESHRLVAPCYRIVPVVIEVDEGADATTFLLRVRDVLAETMRHGDVPFHLLVRALGVPPDPRRNPLIQTVVAMHDTLVPDRLDAAGLQVQVIEEHGGGAPFDLSWFVQRGAPDFGGTLEFATGALTAAEAGSLLDSLIETVERLCADGGGAVGDIRGVTAAQRERLFGLNGPPTEPVAASLAELFFDQVAALPDGLAVRAEDGPEGLTYRELGHLVELQARSLRDAGVGPGDRVIIMVPRSAAEIVGVLGIVTAGAAYVAAAPDVPDERLWRMITATGASAAIAVESHAQRLRALGIRVVIAPFEPDWTRLPPIERAIPPTGPDHVAYVSFTSGSTGTPKGVEIPHGAVVRLALEPEYVRCGPGERIMRFAPLAFDASTWEVWAPLLNGGTVEVCPDGQHSPHELGRFIRERGVTVLFITSGLFRLMVEFSSESFSLVRQVLTGGDVVSPEHVRRLLATHPGLRLTICYGPTENTTYTTVHHIDHAALVEDPLPIGTPIRDTSVYVLDDRARLVPPGAVGELYVAGAGLAIGYASDARETERYFGILSPDLPVRLYRTGDLVRIDGAGRLRFLGRRDDQTKIRGHRVEPAEVRQTIISCPGVRDAVVFATGTNSEDRRLLAGVVTDGPGMIEHVQAAAAARLLPAMRPGIWLEIERIPLTPNGKVDLADLEAAAGSPRARRSPSPHPEAVLASELALATMVEVLDRDDIGDDDNFFDLGGDSFRIARIVETLRKRRGVRIRLGEFYANPTLRHLTHLIERAS